MSRARWLVITLVTFAVVGIVAARVSAAGPVESMNPRAAQRQYLRYLGTKTIEYAQRYRRPAFALDSVLAHLDSRDAVLFRTAMTDLWGHHVFYSWNEATFEVSSGAGTTQARIAWVWDSLRKTLDTLKDAKTADFIASVRMGDRTSIRERYWWPPEARGDLNTIGQYVPAPVNLDTLTARLATAGGHYSVETPGQHYLVDANLRVDEWREHGAKALPRLVECMRDTTATTTRVSDDPDGAAVPRGTLCFEVLTALVTPPTPGDASDPAAAHIPRGVNRDDLYGERPMVASLPKAQRAWDAYIRAGAYDWVMLPP
jgi:hypothetical protein